MDRHRKIELALTRDQVRRIDHLATHRYGISGLVLMENAGRHAAEIITQRFGPTGSAWVCCGTGNNGGDGCVITRHLHNDGWHVRLVLVGDQARMTGDAAANFGIIEKMGLPSVVVCDRTTAGTATESILQTDVVIDALLGTGFQGQVRSPMAEVIDAMNAARKRALVAVDVPSGLDCDTGRPSNATIRADLTITFVARKTGFDVATASTYVGQVEVAGIGAPRELISEVASERV